MFLSHYMSTSKYAFTVIRLCVRNTHKGNRYNHSNADISLGKIQPKFAGISVTTSGAHSTFHCYPKQHLKYYCTANEKRLSSREKLKLAVKDYGATILVFHIAISLVSLAGFYVAVCSGVNITDWLDTMNLKSSQNVASVASGVGTFAIAYAVHKVFAPVRIGITVTAAPVLVRYLRRVGFLKTPKN